MRKDRTLRGRGAFDRVFTSGIRSDGDLLQCFCVLEPAARISVRAGFAVSARHFSAVRRSRIRRLMREAFARERAEFGAQCGRHQLSASLVFLFRGRKGVGVERLSLDPVHRDVAALCRRIAQRME